MYTRLLKRTWQIFWSYKLLWVFGFILALTTCSGIQGLPPDSDGNQGITYEIGESELYSVSSIDELEDDLRELGRRIDDGLLVELREVFVTIAAAVVIVLLWLAVAAVLRYVVETALIRMVDKYEETGKRVSIRNGFRLGFSRGAWRIFLIDMVVRFPVYVLLLALFAFSLLPLLLWLTEDSTAGIVGLGISATLFFILIFVAILIGAVVTLLTQFFRRVCVIEGQGVFASIGHGFAMVLENPKQVVLTGLIALGIQIVGFSIFIPLLVVLIPVELVFILLGVVAAGIPAAMIGGLGAVLFGEPIPWILAGVLALPILILFIAAPFAFFNGLVESLTSILWTLTYRELKGYPVTLEEKQPEFDKAPKPAVI